MNYYWFDTNCFSDLLENRFSVIEKEFLFNEALNNKGMIVISPFVFYEIIKGRDVITEIKDLYDKLNMLPGFCVANYLNVFESNCGLINGKSILEYMKMNEVLGDAPIEYGWFRDGYKKQLGKTYAHILAEYIKVASILYLICEECDEKGHITQRTQEKQHFIEEFNKTGRNQKNIEEMFSEFFINYNYRRVGEEKAHDEALMQEQLMVFVSIFLNSAESKMQLIEENKLYHSAAFNARLAENEVKHGIDLQLFFQTLNNVTKKTNNALSPIKIFKKSIASRIDSIFFSKVIAKFVEKRVFFKSISNDFIDAINIYCAGAFLKGKTNYYYTNERSWMRFLKENSNKDLFEGNTLLCKII